MLSLAWEASLASNPRGSLTKDYPRWGWLGWACKTTGEPTTPTKTFWEARTGEELLYQCENSNRADPFAVVAVKSLRTSGSTTLNERYWPRLSVGHAYAFYTSPFTSLTITRGTA